MLSVTFVSSKTKHTYDVQDGLVNTIVSAASFLRTSSSYSYIPSRCSHHISPPLYGRENDFFLYPASYSPSDKSMISPISLISD